MQTTEMVDRIFAGEINCPSIIMLDNAERLMRWVRDTDRHHTADTCAADKPKDCAHAPGTQTADFAAMMVSEATNRCACGAHGVDDPARADTIVADFMGRWS